MEKENVFSFEFIPVKTKFLKLGLTHKDCIIMSFIDFFIKNIGKDFCFSNKEISNIFDRSPNTISQTIQKLKKLGFISTSIRIKEGGGQIRFIKINKDKN
jgi:predicted transcriptional regulator